MSDEQPYVLEHAVSDEQPYVLEHAVRVSDEQPYVYVLEHAVSDEQPYVLEHAVSDEQPYVLEQQPYRFSRNQTSSISSSQYLRPIQLIYARCSILRRM